MVNDNGSDIIIVDSTKMVYELVLPLHYRERSEIVNVIISKIIVYGYNILVLIINVIILICSKIITVIISESNSTAFVIRQMNSRKVSSKTLLVNKSKIILISNCQ